MRSGRNLVGVLSSVFCFVLGLTDAASADVPSETPAHAQIPVVGPNTFAPGHSWTWDYWDGDSLYSSERYTVMSVQDATVWIEMATRLAGQTEYLPHHRLQVSVDKCLQAYKNPAEKKPWSFLMFHKDGSEWIEMSMTNTLAFEEKFNCNPHLFNKRSVSEHWRGIEYLTVFRDSSDGRLFQQKRWGRIESTWFYLNGSSAGIAAEKAFEPGVGPSYLMKLHRD